MDSETLRPVIIAMTIFLLLSHFIPKMITKPTEIKPIDDVVAYTIAQRGSLTSGTILVGLVVYLSNYVNHKIL